MRVSDVIKLLNYFKEQFKIFKKYFMLYNRALFGSKLTCVPILSL